MRIKLPVVFEYVLWYVFGFAFSYLGFGMHFPVRSFGVLASAALAAVAVLVVAKIPASEADPDLAEKPWGQEAAVAGDKTRWVEFGDVLRKIVLIAGVVGLGTVASWTISLMEPR